MAEEKEKKGMVDWIKKNAKGIAVGLGLMANSVLPNNTAMANEDPAQHLNNDNKIKFENTLKQGVNQKQVMHQGQEATMSITQTPDGKFQIQLSGVAKPGQPTNNIAQKLINMNEEQKNIAMQIMRARTPEQKKYWQDYGKQFLERKAALQQEAIQQHLSKEAPHQQKEAQEMEK